MRCCSPVSSLRRTAAALMLTLALGTGCADLDASADTLALDENSEVEVQTQAVVSVSALQTELLATVNLARSRMHLLPLAANDRLNKAALRHALDMAKFNFRGPTGSDGSSPAQRFEQAGYSFSQVGETSNFGYATPAQVVNTWLQDSVQRAYILSPKFKDAGVSYVFSSASKYKHYWVLDLGAR